MLNKIAKQVKNLLDSLDTSIDPSMFKDPVAEMTSWEPLNVAASNFQTRKFNIKNEDCIEFTPSYHFTFSTIIFIVLSAIIACLFIDVKSGLIFSSISLAFVGGIQTIMILCAAPIVFNKNERTFVKGKGRKKMRLKFSEIYALQLVPAPLDEDRYLNYQLNITLKDGKREHVVTYYKDNLIATEVAQKVARFVGVKLWNATH